MLFVRQMLRVQEGLQRRFPEAELARMGPLLIVLSKPRIEVALQLFKRGVEAFAERHAVELVLDGAVEPLANAVGLSRQLRRIQAFRIYVSESRIHFIRGLARSSNW